MESLKRKIKSLQLFLPDSTGKLKWPLQHPKNHGGVDLNQLRNSHTSLGLGSFPPKSQHMERHFWKPRAKQRIHLVSSFQVGNIPFPPFSPLSRAFFFSSFLSIFLLRSGYNKSWNFFLGSCLASVRPSGRNSSLQEYRHCGNIDSLHLHKRILIMLYHQHL